MDLAQFSGPQLALSKRGWRVYPSSVVEKDGSTYFLARSDEEGRGNSGARVVGAVLGVLGDVASFDGVRHEGSGTLLCPLSPANAAALRKRLPWLRPGPLGLQTSAGFGDRLGLATPGHVRSVRQFDAIAPVFAQQSVRENARTGRTPQRVMDDATWGVFQEGWRGPWGSDADHLKTPADIESFVAAGYTFYTIDPGEHVDNGAHTAPLVALEAMVRALPWSTLEDTLEGMEGRYLGRSFDLEGVNLTFERETLWRAAAKYGRAVAHTAHMYRHLVGQMRDRPFELEVSVDETDTPTSPAEHFYIASELARLGVHWVSLAPRYVGRFEKGVDYIGDLDAFEAELVQHAAIARALGPYKLSIHSGSDKFSIYSLIAKLTEGLVHLKTAGTSYLEALRAVAQMDASLFRGILGFARERYREDRATYHVSGQLAQVPVPDAVSDAELPGLLDQFDARQVLHVTFGSVLDRFGGRLLETLLEHEEVYHRMLEAHFRRHLSLFMT